MIRRERTTTTPDCRSFTVIALGSTVKIMKIRKRLGSADNIFEDDFNSKPSLFSLEIFSWASIGRRIPGVYNIPFLNTKLVRSTGL